MMCFLIVITIVTFFFGDHAYADENLRCELSNSTCQIEFIKYFAITYGSGGFPQCGVGPIEPTTLQPASTHIMDIFKLSLIEGKCYNIVKTCRITKLEMDMVNFRRIVKYNCGRIVIQGRYTLETNPYFCPVLGEVTGCGYGNITLEDWSFYFDNPFRFVKRDGKIYLDVNFDEGVYKTKVQKKATFDADSIKVNNRDITHKVLCFINKYWEVVLDIFGQELFKLAAEYYEAAYKNVYYCKPATEMFTDDLTPYLDEN